MTPDASAQPTQLGNYDVLAKIAEGGMGTVYKARHRFTGETVAIKVIAPGTARNPVILQRFEREFLAAKVLEHPNVVRAIEYCGTGPNPFLVMEYVDGDSLGQRVERNGPIPEGEAVRLIAQICDGLQRAHKQGLVHRDVKPDNILVTREGVAKLTDMGLVKEVDGDLNLTKTGRGLGTPHYMAPEQFRNAKGVDARGDIYSLGATLYAIVTGTVPFENANPLDCWMKKIRNEFPAPKELNPKVSDRVDWAIRRAMSAEASQRPASCREFLEDLTGQSRGSGPIQPVAAASQDMWYMVYRDEAGKTHTVKGGTDAIRNALKDGLLGDASAILVGRSKVGQFQPLHSVPEFRDLVVAPAPLPLSEVMSRRSGSVPRPAPHPQPASDGAVDLGALPPDGPGASSSRSGRTGSTSGRYSGPPSGRSSASQPPGRYTPTPQPTGTPIGGIPRPKSPSSARATPYPPYSATPSPYDETAHYETEVPTPTPLSVPVPANRPRRPQTQAEGRAGKKPFDWTPVMMVLVALVSAAVGYYFFMFMR